MPTRKKRVNIIPDNLPAVTTPEETCPSLFTGQKLAENDPEKYARIVQGLGEGKPLSRIAKTEKVSPETVSAILKRENKSVEAVQSLTAGLTSYASQACIVKIIEKLDQDAIPAGVLPIMFGILRDKEKNDLGQATSVIEHKGSVSIDDVRRELAEMKKDEIRELIEGEKLRKISNFLGGEILKLPKSASKESMIDKISKHFELNEKDIKTLSKENLVELAKSLDIVFYRGRFRMKPEDATKDNLINKILFEKKNKPLESPRKALTVSPSEVLELFGDIESS